MWNRVVIHGNEESETGGLVHREDGSSELGDGGGPGLALGEARSVLANCSFLFFFAAARFPNHLASTVFDTHEGERPRSVC